MLALYFIVRQQRNLPIGVSWKSHFIGRYKTLECEVKDIMNNRKRQSTENYTHKSNRNSY